jgi:hypothetical protein
VDFQWQGSTDGDSGSGVFIYNVMRNGVWLGCASTPAFTDRTAAAGQTYNYLVYSTDRHGNHSETQPVTVVTPAAGSRDPRRTGVRPAGTYWGGAGEQIDLQSGNVNFTLPLVTAMGRNGKKVTFALSYNSQNWRKDAGGVWKLGRDVGYGFGWKLLAGSVTPYYIDYWTVHHYVFTDSSGADYRLDVNTNGVWTSREGIYLRYETATNRLYFTDGGFWQMDALSQGVEEDAGTRYPTRFYDSNGNYIEAVYQAGKGAPAANSSARLSVIRDVRNVTAAYNFLYTNDPLPHLQYLTNTVGTGEGYSFSYNASYALKSPFTPQADFGTTMALNWVETLSGGFRHTLAYGSNGAAELSSATLPYGARLEWTYQDFTNAAGITVREIQYRGLAPSAGAPVKYHAFYFDAGDTGRQYHLERTVMDEMWLYDRNWVFESDPASPYLGLAKMYRERDIPMGWKVLAQTDTTWAQDAAGNPNVAAVLTTLDGGTANEKQSKVTQVVDAWGNVTEKKTYNFGNLTTRVRVHTYTYAASPCQDRDRLREAWVGSTRLFTISYDEAGALVDAPNMPLHDAAWGLGYTCRGNATRVVSNVGQTVTRTFSYNIGGQVTSSNNGVTNVARIRSRRRQ